MPAQTVRPLTKIKQCRNGQMLFLTTDRYIGTSLDTYGEYCESESNVFAQLLSPGQTVFEIGANIGAHTVHLAQLVGPSGKIFAFEPQRIVFQILCANVMLNELLNVHTIHAGSGDTAGILKVPFVDYRYEDSNFGAVSLLDNPDGENVPIIPLDTMDIPALDLLKIDVEGMERKVIEGARKQIFRHRPIIYVENDRAENSADLITLIEGLGYRLWWHLAPLYNADNYFKATENIFGDVVSANMLCVPIEHQSTISGLRPVASPLDTWNAAATP